MEITQHFLISGVVQGVGFRFFTQKNAQNLGLRGWVRNLADGQVEALVQGPKDKMMSFAQLIRRGPVSAQVLYIEQKVVETQESVKEFKILADGDAPWTTSEKLPVK